MSPVTWCKCPDEHKGPHLPNCPMRADDMLEALKQAWACIEHIRQYCPTELQSDATATMKDIAHAIRLYEEADTKKKSGE